MGALLVLLWCVRMVERARGRQDSEPSGWNALRWQKWETSFTDGDESKSERANRDAGFVRDVDARLATSWLLTLGRAHAFVISAGGAEAIACSSWAVLATLRPSLDIRYVLFSEALVSKRFAALRPDEDEVEIGELLRADVLLLLTADSDDPAGLATDWRSHPLHWLAALDQRAGTNGSLVSKAVEHRIAVSAFEEDIDLSLLEPECGADLEPVYRQLFLAGDRCHDSMQDRCCPLVNGGLGPPSFADKPRQLWKQPTHEQLQLASQAEQLIMPYLPPNHISRALYHASPEPGNCATGMWSVSGCFDNSAMKVWPYSTPTRPKQYCLLEQVTCCDETGALIVHLNESSLAEQLNLHTPHVRHSPLSYPPACLNQLSSLHSSMCAGRFCVGIIPWGRLCPIGLSARLHVTSSKSV